MLFPSLFHYPYSDSILANLTTQPAKGEGIPRLQPCSKLSLKTDTKPNAESSIGHLRLESGDVLDDSGNILR